MKKFITIKLYICDMIEKDKLFVDSFLGEVVMELQRKRGLMKVMIEAKHLFD